MSEAVREKKLPGFRKYKPYPAYKDSGVEWLGDVPEHWDLKRLRYTIRACQNGVWGEEPVGGPEDVICVRVADFDRIKNKIVLNEPTFRSVPLRQLEELTLKSGDLLLEKSGGGEQQPVGAVVLYDLGAQSVCSNFIARIKIEDDYSSVFLLYLHKHLYESGVNKRSIKQNTGIQNLDLKSYLSEYVGLPDIKEQIAIASFLDRETAKIDALIAKQERLIELLQEKRVALITRAVTKGLDPDVPMKDSGVEWLGEIPAHWEVLPLKRRFEVRLGKMLQNEPKSSHDEYLPYLRAVNITWKGVDTSDINRMWFSPREKQLYDLQKYDLLVSEGGDVGRSALWQGEIENCYIQNAVNRVRSLGNDKTVFLYYWMFMLKHIGYIDMLCSKATIGHFTAEKVEKILVIFPPPKEQQLIIEVLDKEISKINKLIDRIEKAIDIIKEYRTALISAAVTGKIDVRREVP